eukprot:10340865-Alexandrium_andersonii.AAC.1
MAATARADGETVERATRLCGEGHRAHSTAQRHQAPPRPRARPPGASGVRGERRGPAAQPARERQEGDAGHLRAG